MNPHSLFTEFTNHLSSAKFTGNEQDFINQSCKDIKKLKESNSLFHVVKDSLDKKFNGNGMSLGSIEKIFQQLNADSRINQDQEFIKKIKKIFLEQYATHRGLPGDVDTADTENLLTYLLTKDTEDLFKENSFFSSLSAKTQFELIISLAMRGETEAKGIFFNYFDKIKDLPIESRLEIARVIASQGEQAAQNLGYQLETLHLENASFDQKVDFTVFLLEQAGTVPEFTWERILSLQPKEPKAAYLTFLKAVIQKSLIEPHHRDIDLNKLTEKDVPLEEKLKIAKKVAPLNTIAALYVSNFVTEIHDVELVTLLLNQKIGAVTNSILKNLSSLGLKEASVESRLELTKTIFNQLRNDKLIQNITNELISPHDSLENMVHFVQIVFQNFHLFNTIDEQEKFMEDVFKKKSGGVSLPQLVEVIKRNNSDSKFILNTFNLFHCPVPANDLLGFASVIFEQGPDLTRRFAFNLHKFDIQNVPISQRLEIIKRILDTDPEADKGIAGNLDSVLHNLPISERISLAKTLIQRNEAAANDVAFRSQALKLNEAPIQERVELALMLVQQGKVEARAITSSFYLNEASQEDSMRIAEAFLKQGQPINQMGPNVLNIKALSMEQRFNLVSQMIALKAFSFNKAWLDDMPWESRLKLAKQAVSKMLDSQTPDHWKIFSWDLHDVPFSEKVSIIELYLHMGQKVEHVLKNEYLSFFGENIEGGELITVLKLFSRQSISLLSQALKEVQSPPLSLVACQQALMEFLIDTPLDLELIYEHPALQGIKPLLNLLTMKTLEVQEAVNKTHSLPKDVQTAKLQLKQFLDAKKEDYKMLLSLYDEIEKMNNPMLQFRLMRWLAYTTGQFTEMSIIKVNNPILQSDLMRWLTNTTGLFSEITKDKVEGIPDTGKLKAVEGAKLWETIYKHQSLPNRFIFVRELSHMTETFEPRIVKDGEGKLKEFNEYGKLSWILLTQFKTLGVSKEQLEKINDLIDSKKKFKETKNFSVLVELLNEVILMPPLTPPEAKLFCDRLEKIIQLQTMEQTLQGLQGLTNILSIFGRDNFIKALKEKDINAFFFKEFEKHMSLGDVSDFGSKWQKTFGKSRNPGAIFIYMRSIEKLPKEQREIAKEALGRYIKAVLNGDFPAVRYKTENNPHLTQVFATEEIKKLWLDKGQPIEVGNYIVSFSDDFMDLLLSGTEVQGSCQDIAGDPHLNKCLIGYLNGEIMPIVAKPKGTPDGKIAARIFLRLGWDKVKKCHVILQEALYSNVRDQVLAQGMNQMALDKAKQLSNSLVEHDKYRKTHEAAYAGTFSYLGGSYPYVYSDAAGGPKDGSKGFEIKDCHIITTAS